MNTVLWVLQVVLAALFAIAGVMKATQPKAKLAQRLPWAEDFAPATVRFIGVMELLGAAGLILPAVTGIAPILTPLAAAGLAVMMLLAALTHVRRKEPFRPRGGDRLGPLWPTRSDHTPPPATSKGINSPQPLDRDSRLVGAGCTPWEDAGDRCASALARRVLQPGAAAPRSPPTAHRRAGARTPPGTTPRRRDRAAPDPGSTGQSPAPGPGHARTERGRRPAAPHGPARPAPAGRGRSPTRQRERHPASLHTGPPLRRVTEPARALGMPVLATARQAQRERQPSGKQTTSSPRMIPPEYGPDTIKRETGTTSSEACGSDNAHGQVFSTGCWTMTTPT
jgi:uncharacterized membrane protein YphA (DoxX/SURF4 family)